MNLREVKAKYQNEWILAEVLEADELNRPTKVKIIVHSKNRDDVYEQLGHVEDNRHVTTFYSGEIPEKGYAVVLYGRTQL